MIEVERSEVSPQILHCFPRISELSSASSKRFLKLADSSSVFAICDITLIQLISLADFDVLLSEAKLADRFFYALVFRYKKRGLNVRSVGANSASEFT